ncbi:hypothetical protein EAS54_19260 [Bradyrhizobium guangzhouense]|nr:hypothetical protein EAS54_19260 [Bradyrhizobium guangzhouense]
MSRMAGRVAKNLIGRRQREQIRIGGSGVAGADMMHGTVWEPSIESCRGNYGDRYRKSAAARAILGAKSGANEHRNDFFLRLPMTSRPAP